MSEPAIQVKRQHKPAQIWSLEKLENKLIDMRELHAERGGKLNTSITTPEDVDPFYETQIDYNIIGVANVFLQVLFHDIELDYHVPIISQQGEVAGKLQVTTILSL